MIQAQNDVIGQAGLDYFLNGQRTIDIKVWSDIAETDTLPVHYLFRTYHEMPMLEQKALALCKGNILDAGAGVGSHSLHLQEQGQTVTALEISPLACEVMSRRGVSQVVNADFFKHATDQKYDTILLLMNGIGLVGTVNGFPAFFKKIKDLLKHGGQLLLDSSDLRYLYIDEDGSMLVNLNGRYYGEVEYRMTYGECKGQRFKWLFIDDQLMAEHAEKHGFKFEKIADGSHYDYLARITFQS
jgi:SAM-dependent methyltransferase